MKADRFEFPQRFEQLLVMNEEAFQDGYLDLAYHALLTAFECAHEMSSQPCMLRVAARAREELVWIDKNQTGYKHSSYSAMLRHGGLSLYAQLAGRAERTVAMRETLDRASAWKR